MVNGRELNRCLSFPYRGTRISAADARGRRNRWVVCAFPQGRARGSPKGRESAKTLNWLPKRGRSTHKLAPGIPRPATCLKPPSCLSRLSPLLALADRLSTTRLVLKSRPFPCYGAEHRAGRLCFLSLIDYRSTAYRGSTAQRFHSFPGFPSGFIDSSPPRPRSIV